MKSVNRLKPSYRPARGALRKVTLAESKTLLSAALIVVTTLLGTGAAAGQESGSETFNDIPAGHWADQAIGWAVANDITRGMAADRFDPDGTVTRAQIVTFLYRTFHFIQGNPVTTGAAEGTIAFSSNRDGDHEVYLMNSDGSNVRQLTHNTHHDTDPSWSPDGAQIAFASHREGDAEIFLMNADGTNLRQLTDNSHYDAAPAWSPDGAQITFQRWGDGNSDVYLMNADGTAQRKLTNKKGSDFFDDVPEGDRANETIGWAAAYGITSGVGQSRFDPDGTVTRAQIVTFLHRMVNLAQSTRPPS